MKHGVFITPEYAALARKTDAARAELVMKYGNFFDFFPGQHETDPQYIEYNNDMNKLIAEYSGGAMKPKTFTGYIDEIWKECIANSDQCVVTGKKPTSKK